MRASELLERLVGPGACTKTIRLEGKEPSGRVRFCVLGEDGEVERCGVTAAEVHDPRLGFLEALARLEAPRPPGAVRNRVDPTTPTVDVSYIRRGSRTIDTGWIKG